MTTPHLKKLKIILIIISLLSPALATASENSTDFSIPSKLGNSTILVTISGNITAVGNSNNSRVNYIKFKHPVPGNDSRQSVTVESVFGSLSEVSYEKDEHGNLWIIFLWDDIGIGKNSLSLPYSIEMVVKRSYDENWLGSRENFKNNNLNYTTKRSE